jgi:DNA polymerase-3 subunit delta'
MGLDRIRGQEQAISLLRSAFDSGRLAHAYLFRGPYGVGKETVALELAKALHCEAEGFENCGDCPACKMSDGQSHPDTHLIFPVPRTIKPAERAERVSESVKNGFRDEDFGRKTAIISVETILADVVVKAGKRPYIGPWKVFIIADADRMTTEAANTLLKTLEEPPAQTVLILTSSRSGALPVTVVSRCQKIPFSRLSRADVETVLTGDPRLGMDARKARAASAIARGSPGLAVRANQGGLAAELKKVAAIMDGSRTRGVRPLIEEANRLAYNLGRDEQQKALDLMLLWLRDVLVVSESKDAAVPELLYSSYANQIRSQADIMELEDLEELITKIDEARRAIERYSSPSIVFTSVLLDMAVVRKRAATRER